MKNNINELTFFYLHNKFLKFDRKMQNVKIFSRFKMGLVVPTIHHLTAMASVKTKIKFKISILFMTIS